MVFKPFRPPLIKKPPQSSDSTHNVRDTNPSIHPCKRLCVDDSENQSNKDGKVSRLVPSTDVNAIGGLVRVKRLHEKTIPTNHTSVLERRPEVEEVEAYYNVLWRKPTTKKHKTWDGDGIIAIRGGYASLRDVSGQDMGRIMCNSLLEPGTTLSIGGRIVEVDSSLSKEEFLSGQSFLSSGASPAPLARQQKVFLTTPSIPSRQTNNAKLQSEYNKDISSKTSGVTTTRTLSTNSSFKNLVKNTAIPANKPTSQPIPRHDPNAVGALVMKRPNSVPEGRQIVDVVIDPLLTKHLREHQREGVKFLYECVMGLRNYNGEGAILADEMGLGKTLQTITLLWTLLKQNFIYGAPPVIKKALIVCPVTLVNNWRKEFRKWLGNERIGIFVCDDKKKRLTDFTMGKAYSVMIVGYEKLRTVQEGLTKGAGVDIIIADEGHRLKTLQNKSSQAIQSLNTMKRVILSGTPIQNDLSEFFAAVDLVNPGLLGTYKTFVKEFEGPIVRSRQPEATKKDIEKGEARNEELRELTTMFMLRRTSDILSKFLLPKTEYVLFCNPTPIQAKIYRHVLASPVFQSALGNSECVLQLITILKKLCNSPSLLATKNAGESSPIITALLSALPPNLLRHFSPSSSGKLRALDQLLHNIRSTTTEKIVLVSNYTSTLTLLASLLTSLSLPFLRLDGSTPSAKRQSLVDDFNRSSASVCFAFLLSAKAGGTGLNLIGASRLVLFDVDWNPATDMQAMARIHRDGQKRHCQIYRIILKGGLEEKIWQRQVTKIGLADSVMEQRGGIAQFSREELRDLFRLDEGEQCQTHELIGCRCGGRGQVSVSQGENETIPAPPEAECGEMLSENDRISISLEGLPKLIKASELDIKAQERRDGSHPVQSHRREEKQGKSDKVKMQHFLSQYSHINPGYFIANDGGASTDPSSDADLAQQIDDPALLSVLKDEDNSIGYVFKKHTFPSVSSEME